MISEKRTELKDFYRSHLLNDIVPWWEKRMVDTEYGGYFTYFDRDGRLLSSDKPVWFLGRIAWMWSRLYNCAKQDERWLETARGGIDFMLKHAFDADGRMFFRLTREGQPLIKRRYLFSECFGIIALAEYARASGSQEMLERAKALYRLVMDYYRNPGRLPAKINPETRPLKGHAMPMILLSITQVLREANPEEEYNGIIDALIRGLDDFIKPEKKCLLETVHADGSILDNPEGRTVNPGHAIETSWFLMEEARRRKDDALLRKACQILEWSLEIGWDREQGGILYYVDCDGFPADFYEHELKLWWPHTEALYALLLAEHLTGEEKWANWYEKVHDYAFSHFPDSEQGEWFGYLRRDGTVSNRVKGNYWKGPFHLPRTLLNCWTLLEEKEQSR